MKVKLTNELIYANLDLIFRADKNGISSNNFIDNHHNKLTDSAELVAYLLKFDLIETELDDQIFFLTPEGYEAHENGFWHDSDLVEREVRELDRNSIYNPLLIEENSVKPIRISTRMQASIVGGLVTLGTYLIGSQVNHHSNKEIPSTSLFENISIQLDSLKSSKNGHPTYKVDYLDERIVGQNE